MNRLNWLIDKYDIGNEDISSKRHLRLTYLYGSVWLRMIAQAVLLPSGEEGNPEKSLQLYKTIRLQWYTLCLLCLTCLLTLLKRQTKPK
ncbi:hypothetical protein J4710_02765 [Staphylococcus xylosus]|uniref:Uncharacterized protein n=1 Tax=Staphylococcus xylosus TaxID=1288 RepID=A0A939NDL8_STAXY|nr:hypothetical protein [Staphylococcus xylosus]